MSRVAVAIADMFEDVEFTEPAEAFKQAGHEVVTIGLKRNAVVKGKKKGTEVVVDQDFRGADVDVFDALFIPGGYSPDRLRAFEEAVEFTRAFWNTGKPVLVICHGPQLLITADVLEGRTLTGWRSIAQDLKNAGANYVDRELVEDGNLISSRGPGDLPAFIQASLDRLA